MKKKLLSILLSLSLAATSAAAAFAAETTSGTDQAAGEGLLIATSATADAASVSSMSEATSAEGTTSGTDQAAGEGLLTATSAAEDAAADNAAGSVAAENTKATASVKNMKPVLTKVSSAGYNKIKLTWEKLNGVSGYMIYRATKKNGEYKRVKTIDDPNVTSYTNTKRTTGKTYYYKIRAYRINTNLVIYSKYSAVKSAYARPSKVKNVSVEYADTAVVYFKVDWDKVSGASGYQLQVKPASTGKWSTYYRKKGIDGKWYKTYPTEWNSKKERHDVKYIILGRTAYWSLSNAEDSYQIRVRAYKTVNGKKVYGLYSEPVTITPAWTSAEELVDFVHSWVAANYESYNRAESEYLWKGATPQDSNWGTSWTYATISQYEPKERVLSRFLEGKLAKYFSVWWGLDEKTEGILYTEWIGLSDGTWQVWWLS